MESTSFLNTPPRRTTTNLRGDTLAPSSLNIQSKDLEMAQADLKRLIKSLWTTRFSSCSIDTSYLMESILPLIQSNPDLRTKAFFIQSQIKEPLFRLIKLITQTQSH